MSAAVVTALKKIAITFLTDKKGRKAVGSIIAISVTLVLLPAMVLMAIGNHFSGGNKVNYIVMRLLSIHMILREIFLLQKHMHILKTLFLLISN